MSACEYSLRAIWVTPDDTRHVIVFCNITLRCKSRAFIPRYHRNFTKYQHPDPYVYSSLPYINRTTHVSQITAGPYTRTHVSYSHSPNVYRAIGHGHQ